MRWESSIYLFVDNCLLSCLNSRVLCFKGFTLFVKGSFTFFKSTLDFDFIAVSIDYPREILYERIHLRVEQMFENGLLEEVKDLLKNGVSKTAQCMQGIGYKEVAEGLELGLSLEEIKELIYKISYSAQKNGFQLGVSFVIKFLAEICGIVEIKN